MDDDWGYPHDIPWLIRNLHNIGVSCHFFPGKPMDISHPFDIAGRLDCLYPPGWSKPSTQRAWFWKAMGDDNPETGVVVALPWKVYERVWMSIQIFIPHMGENTPCLTPEGIGDTDDMRGRKETQGSATEVTGWVVFPGYDYLWFDT